MSLSIRLKDLLGPEARVEKKSEEDTATANVKGAVISVRWNSVFSENSNSLNGAVLEVRALKSECGLGIR